MNRALVLGLALPISPFCIMFSMATGLMAGDFRRVFASPAGVMTVPTFCYVVWLNRRRAAIA